MISFTSGPSSAGQPGQMNRNMPHGTSELGMVQTPRRVRMQRSTEGLSGSGEDRPVRHELVRQIKAQIMSGVYDSPAKVEAAAERLSRALDLTA
jgi:hypothetical protein